MSIGQGDIIVRTFQNTPTVWVSERLICDALGDNMDEYLRVCARSKYKSSVSPCHRMKDILPGPANRGVTPGLTAVSITITTISPTGRILAIGPGWAKRIC